MHDRKNEIYVLTKAGALIGALAALVVAAIGHLVLWLGSSKLHMSSGATQGTDLWSYYSMARAVWRSPNGITYAYPYALYWPVPEINFQLPITILAWLGKLTGLPLAFEIGRIAGAAGAGAAIAALGAAFPRGFWMRWFYVAAVLGGGLFHIGAIVLALQTAGLLGLTEVYQYQPHSEGRLFWWLPYLARNLRMPLECIYHAIVIGSLVCLFYRRLWWGWLLGVAAWMSNPFSAIALHAAVVPWLLWATVFPTCARRTNYAVQLAAWLAVNAGAAAYYGWFLNQWQLMSELRELYRSHYQAPLDFWRLLMLFMPYAVGLLASAFVPAMRRDIWGNPRWRLFAILALAHIALLQQSAILGERSMQSFHYNRGYLHLGLVVVAWRGLMLLVRPIGAAEPLAEPRTWLPNKLPLRRSRIAGCAVVVMVLISVLDQAMFGLYAVGRRSAGGLVDRDFAELVHKIPTDRAPYIVLTEPTSMPGSYVTAFSPHVSWDAGETMIVPFWADRDKWVSEALEGQHGGVASLGIDYAIVYQSNNKRFDSLQSQGWKIIARSEYLSLLESPDPQPGLSPLPPLSLTHPFLP